ncbi:hypothetical protein CCP3SC15_6850002 [Gammaproteobacteria bacterium]
MPTDRDYKAERQAAKVREFANYYGQRSALGESANSDLQNSHETGPEKYTAGEAPPQPGLAISEYARSNPDR